MQEANSDLPHTRTLPPLQLHNVCHSGIYHGATLTTLVAIFAAIQAAFKAKGIKTCRIDGTTKPGDRAVLVAKFEADASIPVFLLSSKAGGVGITLTAADRVVLLDPSWNPATDNQASHPCPIQPRLCHLLTERDDNARRAPTLVCMAEGLCRLQIVSSKASAGCRSFHHAPQRHKRVPA